MDRYLTVIFFLHLADPGKGKTLPQTKTEEYTLSKTGGSSKGKKH